MKGRMWAFKLEGRHMRRGAYAHIEEEGGRVRRDCFVWSFSVFVALERLSGVELDIPEFVIWALIMLEYAPGLK